MRVLCGMARGFAAILLALILGAEAFGAGTTSNGDVQITILQTTDLHHHANGADHVGLDVDPVNATSTIGAYSRIAAYVNQVRATAGHPVVLVDSGDWTMGTLYDLTLGSQPLALYFLDLLRYDCVTLGNHEFDYGPDGLAQMLGTAQSRFGFRTPIVASNMSLGGPTALASFFGTGKLIQSFRVQELGRGVKIGYIGLMGRAAALAAPTSAPVTFADPATRYGQIQSLVDSLRRDQDVNIVVALSHSGTDATGSSGEDIELAQHVRGINVIASGHTHTPLASARTVVNGTWKTFIVDAGAFGTNVARIDLTYHRIGKTTTLDASSNLPMTNATLAGLAPDPGVAALVRATDLQLNALLGPLFSQTFPDYDAANLGKGIYHPVGATAQDMVSNEPDPAPAPNGLGDLAADAVRAVPNGIIAQTLTAVAGNPANLPGYDFTPVQLGVVATGVLRGKLRAGVPLSFADVYDVLPLGISPDASQALRIGFPIISGYMEVDDLKKLCALQLVVQSDLAAAENYVNLSGIRCGLRSVESASYFKFATAAGVLQVTSQKAAAGSASAQAALGALSTLGSDSGAALLAAAAGGNPYAAAMVNLNDGVPSPTNLAALGQVAGAAAAGGNNLSVLIVAKATAAIDTIAGFSPADAANVGPALDLLPGVRVRVAADLYAILSLGAVQALFGTTITVYQSPGGPPLVSLADMMANRVDIAPSAAGVQELKEWMALLSYLAGGLQGFVGPAYASTGTFTQFSSFGLAVTNRNASYPVGAVGQLVGTLAALKAAP